MILTPFYKNSTFQIYTNLYKKSRKTRLQKVTRNDIEKIKLKKIKKMLTIYTKE